MRVAAPILAALLVCCFPAVGNAQVTTPPVVEPVPGAITISPPVSGSLVAVKVGATAIQQADASTMVWVENSNTGETSAQEKYDDLAKVLLNVVAGSGDSLVLWAENPGYGSDSAEIGFVPPPTSDSARPDYDRSIITAQYLTASQEMRVDLPANSLFDQSFPLSLTARALKSATYTAPISVPGSGDRNTSAHTVIVPASSSDLVEVRIADDFGNTQSFYVSAASIGYPVVQGSFPAGYQSAGQSLSEFNGTNVVVAAGVSLPSREFLTSEGLAIVESPPIALSVDFSYRSGLGVNDSFGQSWDCTIDKRLEVGTRSRDPKYLITGSGMRVGPFTWDSARTNASTIAFSSPAGIFSELQFDVAMGAYLLTSSDGTTDLFGSNGRLHSVHAAPPTTLPTDPAPGIVTIDRNSYGQAIALREAGGATHRLGYYLTGQLACFEDPHFATTWFDYTSTGERTTVYSHHDGTSTQVRKYAYDTAGLLKEIQRFGSKILENTYDASGLMEAQRDWDSRNWSPLPSAVLQEWRFNSVDPTPYGVSQVVTVTDPEQGLHAYGFSASPTAQLELNRTYMGKRAALGFPGQADAAFFEKTLTYSATNLQPVTVTSTEAGSSDQRISLFSYEAGGVHADARYRNRLTSSSVGDGTTMRTETWRFGQQGDLLFADQHTDSALHVTHFVHDAFGRLLESSTQVNELVSPPNAGANPTDAVYTLKWVRTKREYDSLGRLSKSWSSDRLRREELLPQGQTYPASEEFDYLASGPGAGRLDQRRVVSEQGVTAYTWTSSYDLHGRSETETDERGNSWEYTYDSLGRLVSAMGPEVTYSEAVGFAVPIRAVETRSYLRPEDPFSPVVGVAKDWIAPTGSAIENGVVTASFEYDPLDRTVATVGDIDTDSANPRQSRTETSYDFAGREVVIRRKLTAQDWAEQELNFDELGRPIVKRIVANAGGETIDHWTRFDFNGDLVEEFDQLLHTLHSYNEFGQPETVTQKDVLLANEPGASEVRGDIVTTMIYDTAGNMVHSWQAVHHSSGVVDLTSESRVRYDELNRVCETWVPRSYGLSQASTDWHKVLTKYNADSNVVASYKLLDDGAATQTTLFDEFSRTKEKEDALGNRWVFEYGDGYSLVTSKKYWAKEAETAQPAEEDRTVATTYDPYGRVVTTLETDLTALAAVPPETPDWYGTHYAYDSLGCQVRSQNFGSHPTEPRLRKDFDYFANGELREVELGTANIGLPPSAKRTYEVDHGGRVVAQVIADTAGGPGRRTETVFDLAGRILELHLPSRTLAGQCDRTVLYTYDLGTARAATVTGVMGEVEVHTSNELGQLVSLEVQKNGVPNLAGLDMVTFSYVHNGVGSTSPLSAVTWLNNGTAFVPRTECLREYSPGGQVISDTVSVFGDAAPTSATVQTGFDLAGRLSAVTYPDRHEFELSRSYYPNGQIRTVVGKEGTGNPVKLLDATSRRGLSLTSVSSFDALGNLIATVDDTRGPFAQTIGRTITANGQNVHSEGVTGTDQSGNPLGYQDDGAPGFLVNKLLEVMNSGVGSIARESDSPTEITGPDAVSYGFQLDTLGQVANVTLDDPGLSAQSSHSWSIGRDAAGFLSPGAGNSVGDHPVGVMATGETVYRDSLIATVDDTGFEHFRSYVTRAGGCIGGGDCLRIQVEIVRDRDIYGRTVWEQRTRQKIEQSGFISTPGIVLSEAGVFITTYDAYGRAVSQEVNSDAIDDTGYVAQPGIIRHDYVGKVQVGSRRYSMNGDFNGAMLSIGTPSLGMSKIRQTDAQGNVSWATKARALSMKVAWSNSEPGLTFDPIQGETIQVGCAEHNNAGPSSCVLNSHYIMADPPFWHTWWSLSMACPQLGWFFGDNGEIVHKPAGWSNSAYPLRSQWLDADLSDCPESPIGPQDENEGDLIFRSENPLTQEELGALTEEELRELLGLTWRLLSKDARASILSQLNGMSGSDAMTSLAVLTTYAIVFINSESNDFARDVSAGMLNAFFEAGGKLLVDDGFYNDGDFYTGGKKGLRFEIDPTKGNWTKQASDLFRGLQKAITSDTWGKTKLGKAFDDYHRFDSNGFDSPAKAVFDGKRRLKAFTKSVAPAEVLVGAVNVIITSMFEPYDWAMALGEMADGDWAAASAFLPFMSTGIRKAAKGASGSDEFVEALGRNRPEVFGMCFAAGTLITTEDGLKPIESVSVGDLVLSKEVATGELGWKPVLHCFETENQEVVAVTLVDAEGTGETVISTVEHPFFVVGRGWIPANLLVEDSNVAGVDGAALRVVDVKRDLPPRVVYNFEVKDWHAYFVGSLGALVHNASRSGLSAAHRDLAGTAKKARWAKSNGSVGLRGHFRKHGDKVGASSAKEYDLSARETIRNGREFTYRDRGSGERRVGYWDADTGLFTATSQTRSRPAIMSHYPETWSELRGLPGFSVR